ncbi:MAG: hypothetical protein HYU42_01785 [Candidatus Rokubacteria bacterium]|nr:hypothetical protein [Candidatus Rokubacteria bacterium]MBI2197321.1 hypothetical protein [Candidatus Rokubacteria bacterium]MBI3107624.1 hypothetical protein [Candidatus Rokubacteria bacterium]
MKRYTGSEMVEPGLYFNPRQLSFKSVDEEGPLPGSTDEVYRRVPILVLLVVGPILGLAYAVFLPFIGFAIVTWLLGVKAGQLAGGAARGAVRVLRPGWEPSMAFLSRSTPARTKREAPDEWAEDVRKKLDPPGHDAT